MRRRLLACSMMVLAVLTSDPVLAQEQEGGGGQAVFKAGVDLVTVSATVRDRRGRLVAGLEARDFEVVDGGQRRAISQFRTDRAPVSLAILFDVSGSMDVAARMTAAKFAAHHLLSWLEPGRDEAALFAFDSRLHEVAPFTVDTRALNGALGEVDPFGATSLHDAIAEAASRVAMRNHPRRAVVVLTDGIDTASAKTAAQVSGMASAIDVPVYVIAAVLAIDDPSLGSRHTTGGPTGASGHRHRRGSRALDRRPLSLRERPGLGEQGGEGRDRRASPAVSDWLRAGHRPRVAPDRSSDQGRGAHRARPGGLQRGGHASLTETWLSDNRRVAFRRPLCVNR